MNPPDPIRARAELHKPRDAEGIERAAHDLAASGYSVFTIAHILRLDAEAVRGMLGPEGAGT
jgi:hypothetical protein